MRDAPKVTRAPRVYGWLGWRAEAPGPRHQTREIVAARSKAEAARIAGCSRPSQMFNLSETGNHEEISAALSHPGFVLWRGINERTAAPFRIVGVEPERREP